MNENEQTNVEQTNNEFNTNQQSNNFNMYNTQTTPKKKKSMIWLLPVLLIVVIIAVIAIGYWKYTQPEEFYKRLISSALDTYTELYEEVEYDTYKADVELDVNLELEEEILDKEILDLINNVQVQIGAQIDKEDKKIVVELESDYDKEELLDAQIFMDAENNETYLFAEEFIDKYLEIEIEDENYSQIKELFEPKEEISIIEKQKINK